MSRIASVRDFNSDECGAGSVLSLAVLATVACVAGLLAPIIGLLVLHDRAQALSDQAALAAADALNGVILGVPCEVASAELESVRASSWRCQTRGEDAFVSGSFTFGPLRFEVRSRAGSPEE